MAKNDKVKMYVSTLNLRPRVDGKPVWLEAGKPFDGALIDKESLKKMVEAGTVKIADVVEEAPKSPEASKTPEAPGEKPTGIWDFKREDMEQLDIVTLNALYKERAEANGLEAKMIEDKEALLDILCSEA